MPRGRGRLLSRYDRTLGFGSALDGSGQCLVYVPESQGNTTAMRIDDIVQAALGPPWKGWRSEGSLRRRRGSVGRMESRSLLETVGLKREDSRIRTSHRSPARIGGHVAGDAGWMVGL